MWNHPEMDYAQMLATLHGMTGSVVVVQVSGRSGTLPGPEICQFQGLLLRRIPADPDDEEFFFQVAESPGSEEFLLDRRRAGFWVRRSTFEDAWTSGELAPNGEELLALRINHKGSGLAISTAGAAA
jgi:hypothetical protein